MKKLIISLSAILLLAVCASAQDEGRKSGDAPAASKYSVPELTIRERVVGDVLILDLEGKLSEAGGADALGNAIRGSVRDGRINILVNFAGVTGFEGDPVVAALILGQAEATGAGGKLKVLNVSNRFRELLRVNQLDTRIEVYGNEDEALRSYGSASD